MRRVFLGAVAALVAVAPDASACSTCGCSLSSDWASQGYSAGEGVRVDLRADYFNQDDLRSGTRAANRAGFAVPNDAEIQQKTVNRNALLTVDYSPNDDWGFGVLVPYADRFHSTIAPGDDGISTSHTKALGDVRLVARYQGVTADRDMGLQVGVKLATGRFHEPFADGPQAGEPLDRGLQPGSGTTDALVGAYRFGVLAERWEYFGQALVQVPLNSRESFRPGAGLNVNFGLRYSAMERVIPQIQVNLRAERRESGENADRANSGVTLAYLSPGLSVRVAKDLQLYGFVQVPIYQRVNGLQIEPRYTASIGLRFSL